MKKIDSGIEVLCGAGVKNGADVEAALELGASRRLAGLWSHQGELIRGAVLNDLVSRI